MENKCKTEVWSRVCGFFRPINNWNKGKKSEHQDKKTYDTSKLQKEK